MGICASYLAKLLDEAADVELYPAPLHAHTASIEKSESQIPNENFILII
jgi:hypothetical protein